MILLLRLGTIGLLWSALNELLTSNLPKGNGNGIKNSKANNILYITFNITILLMLVTHSKQTMKKPIAMNAVL